MTWSMWRKRPDTSELEQKLIAARGAISLAIVKLGQVKRFDATQLRLVDETIDVLERAHKRIEL